MIHRHKKVSSFVTLDTHCLRNQDIKWDAKGLHSYLCQLPSDWQINISDLTNRSNVGRDGTSAPMNELIKAGYIIRQKTKNENGKFAGYEYHVFERPEYAAEWIAINGISVNGISVNGISVNGKTATSKYEESNYEEQQQQMKNENIDVAVFDPEVNALIIEQFKAEVKLPPIPLTPPRFVAFEIDVAASELKNDPLAQERYLRDSGVMSYSVRANLDLTEAYTIAINDFVSKQKSTGFNYNNRIDFRKHFFNWVNRKRAIDRTESNKEQPKSILPKFLQNR